MALAVFYASVVGAATVAVLTLPKLLLKYLKVRNLSKEIYKLKKRSVDLEKQAEEKSEIS